MAAGPFLRSPSLASSRSSGRGLLFRPRVGGRTFYLVCLSLAAVGFAGLAFTHFFLSVPPSAAVAAVVEGRLSVLRPAQSPLIGAVRKTVSKTGSPPPAFGGYGAPRRGLGPTCVVSDSYRFIYVSMQKASSTTIRVHLINALCGSHKAADEPGSNCTLPLLNYRETPMHYERCSRVPRSKFANYYTFTLTRNVWARAVSSYIYCRQKDAINASWADWCADPDMDRACSHVPNGVEPAFEPARPRVRGTDEHWALQQPRFCTEDGDCWVDYVGRSKEVEQHFPAIIAKINGRRPAGVPPLPPFVNKVFNRRPGSRKTTPADWYLSRESMSAAQSAALDDAGVQTAPSCRDAIGRYYATDVAAFGQKFEDILPEAAR